MFSGDDFKCTNDTQLHMLLKILKLTKLFTSEITLHTTFVYSITDVLNDNSEFEPSIKQIWFNFTKNI